MTVENAIMPTRKSFKCDACGHSQSGGKPFTVTAVNLPALLVLFLAAGRSGHENLMAGSVLCTQSRMFSGPNGKWKQAVLPPRDPRRGSTFLR